MLNITAAGRLGRDAETKSVGDSTVTKFAVAVDIYQNREKSTQWIDCDMWGDRGAKVAQYLVKGASVTVTGEGMLREYQGRDGSMKSALSLRVNGLTLQGGKSESTAESRPQSSGIPPQQARAQKAHMAAQMPPPADDFGDSIPF